MSVTSVREQPRFSFLSNGAALTFVGIIARRDSVTRADALGGGRISTGQVLRHSRFHRA